MSHQASCNAAFRRHQMGQLLHRLGALLPRMLNGPDLALESRGLEQRCWVKKMRHLDSKRKAAPLMQ